MWTKFLSKLSCSALTRNYNSKFITNSCWRYHATTQALHDWKRQMSLNQEKRKIIPKLIYLHNPWKYILAKFGLLKFRIFWDPNFVEAEFIRGAKQNERVTETYIDGINSIFEDAAAVLTNLIRNQKQVEVKQFTTPVGYKQITRDMLLSRDDSRLKLVRFEPEHLRRAILMKVVTKQNNGHRFCFIDMLFVGMRNTKDFDTPEEAVEIRNILRKLDTDLNSPLEVMMAPHRIVFAKIFIRFRRDYTNYSEEFTLASKTNDDDKDWSVAFYKILAFDVFNYETKEQN